MASKKAQAELLAPPFTIRAGSTSNDSLLIAQPPEKHHFNIDAPMKLHVSGAQPKDVNPTHAGLHEVDFDTSQAGAVNEGVISLFLCDDAGKYCEKHDLKVNWKNGTQKAEHTIPTLITHATNQTARLKKKDEHGFYDNQFELALQEAKKKGALLLIDFYGIWCPPCNELNDLVFNRREFKKASQNFIQLKLDVDSPATDELSQRYKILGFPTIVITDAEGSELTRIVGYRPLKDFVGVMQEAWSGFKNPAKQDNRQARDRLGLNYFNNSEFTKAIEYLTGTQQQLEKLTDAQIAQLEEKEKSGDKSARSARLELLKKAIPLYPHSPETLDRLDGLAQLAEEDKNEAEAKKLRQDIVVHARAMIEHPEWLQGYDADLGGLWTTLAETQALLGDSSGAAASWKNAISQYESKFQAGDVRGGSLELAYCLRKSDRIVEAMALYEKMEKLYPDEFTFYFGHARALFALKRSKEALPLAKVALEHSYGMNRLNSAELLAKIHSDLNEKDMAKKVIEDALKGVNLSSASGTGFQSRFQKKIQQLNQFAQKI